MGKKRSGRSFWQPDGTKEVRDFVIHEWVGLWQAPAPPETTSAWREAMKSQKQAILQTHHRPVNGHRYPGKKKNPPQETVSHRPAAYTTLSVLPIKGICPVLSDHRPTQTSIYGDTPHS